MLQSQKLGVKIRRGFMGVRPAFHKNEPDTKRKYPTIVFESVETAGVGRTRLNKNAAREGFRTLYEGKTVNARQPSLFSPARLAALLMYQYFHCYSFPRYNVL